MIFPALILAVLAAPASSKELGYWVNDSVTTYDDGWCQGQNWKGKCVRRDRDFEVPTPDGKGVGKVKYVQKTKSADTPAKWGLADSYGQIIIDPDDGEGMALTTRSMLLCHPKYKGCVVYSADERTKKLSFAQTLPLPGGVPAVFIRMKDERGVWGLAPLHRDGTLGRVLSGASVDEGVASGDLAVMQVHDSSGATASVLIDVMGHELWAGPELRVYGVPNAKNDSGNGYAQNAKRSTLMAVGPAPLRVLESDPNMYRPFDGNAPVDMPAGVLGVIPARVSDPSMRGDEYGGKRPDNAWCWIVASQQEKKKRFFVSECESDTGPLDVLKQYPNLEEIDDATIVQKDLSGRDWKPGVLVVHRAKQKDWMALTSKGAPRGYGATVDAAFEDWNLAASENLDKEIAKQRRLAVEEKEQRERAREERAARDAAALEKQREIWAKFIPDFDSRCDGWVRCTAVEDAAFGLGDPYLTQFLSHQETLNRASEIRVPRACAVSVSACQEVQRLAAIVQGNEERMREQRWQLENGWKAYTQQRIQEIRSSNKVNISYYEGGRLKFKTISSDEYKRLYGN